METNENGNGAHRLDLDALFGVDGEPLTLTWQGRTYAMVRPNALGPREILRVESLQKRIDALASLRGAAEISAAEAADFTQLYGDLLGIVCPEMDATGMPFLALVRALDFYMRETKLPDADAQKKK